MRAALPYINITEAQHDYLVGRSQPIFPKKNLHVYRSYNIRIEENIMFSIRGIRFYFGWLFIAKWRDPNAAINIMELPAAISYLVGMYRFLNNK